jgi:hypothetical protein
MRREPWQISIFQTASPSSPAPVAASAAPELGSLMEEFERPADQTNR